MYAQTRQPKENKSRAVAKLVSQKKSSVKQGIGFVDNRTEADAQRKLQEIANDQSVRQLQPIQRAIEADRAGAYKGFTLGGALPTLYFTKGRLTQVHKKADNVGWHDDDPRTKNERFNINQEGRDILNEARKKKGDDRWANLERVMRKICNGDFAPTNEKPAVQLVEIDWTKGFLGGRKSLKKYHPSRSSLQKPNVEYDNNYAMSALEEANEAANNKRWVLAGCWPCRTYVNV